MNQLAPVASASIPLPALLRDDIAAARDFVAAEKCAATRRAYRSDFRLFARLLPRPRRRAAAGHCRAGGGVPVGVGAARREGVHDHPPRRRDPLRAQGRRASSRRPTPRRVKAVMRGIRRTIGTAKAQKAPATADRVRAMLDGCPDTLRGLRDRALLALGFAGAFRRSELVALTVGDVTEGPDGFRVTIRHSKTDQEGAGQTIAIPRGAKLRPVEAVQAWLAGGRHHVDGPIFRRVRQERHARHRGPDCGQRRPGLKEHAARAGLDPAAFAGHSLRAGFLTSAAEAGRAVFKMMEVSRHRSVDTLRGYVRPADLFRDHAGAAFL